MEGQAFFQLHAGLTREGPGDDDSLNWALQLVGVPKDGVICDAGCGPGDDIAGLLTHVPQGRVEAYDLHAPFVAQAAARHQGDARVRALTGDMSAVTGPYDLIWSAGAIYFLGVEAGLRGWRDALVPAGAVAFSQACWFTDAPSKRAQAYWAREYPAMTDDTTVLAQARAAGYDILGNRRLPDAAWEAYFGPMEQRIADLRPSAGAALMAVLDEAEDEIATWRACRAEYGYLLVVARKT